MSRPARRDVTHYDLPRLADELPKLAALSDAFAQSNLFRVQNCEQALVKLLMGSELGLSPMHAMAKIHLVPSQDGISLMLDYTIYGRKIRESKRYDFRITEHTDEACEVEFYETPRGTRDRRKWVHLGTLRTTIEDAERRGWTKSRKGTPKQNYAKHPRVMLLARTIGPGCRAYCPDAIDGGVYCYGEILPGDLDDEPAEPQVGPQPDDVEATFTPNGHAAGPCSVTGGAHVLAADGGCAACGEGTQRDVKPDNRTAAAEGSSASSSPSPPAVPCAHPASSLKDGVLVCEACGEVLPEPEPPKEPSAEPGPESQPPGEPS